MAPGGRGLFSASELPSLNHSASIYSIRPQPDNSSSTPHLPPRAAGVLPRFCVFNSEDTNEADMGAPGGPRDQTCSLLGIQLPSWCRCLGGPPALPHAAVTLKCNCEFPHLSPQRVCELLEGRPGSYSSAPCLEHRKPVLSVCRMNPRPHPVPGAAREALPTPSSRPLRPAPRPPACGRGAPKLVASPGVSLQTPFPDSLRSCRLESLTVTFSCQKGFISGAHGLWTGGGRGSSGPAPWRGDPSPQVPPSPQAPHRERERRVGLRGMPAATAPCPPPSRPAPGPRVRGSAARGGVRPQQQVPGPLPRQVRQRPECELRGSSWLRLAPPAPPRTSRAPLSSRRVSMMYQKSVPMAAASSTKLSAPASAATPASTARGTRMAQLPVRCPRRPARVWNPGPGPRSFPASLAPPPRVSPAPSDHTPTSPSAPSSLSALLPQALLPPTPPHSPRIPSVAHSALPSLSTPAFLTLPTPPPQLPPLLLPPVCQESSFAARPSTAPAPRPTVHPLLLCVGSLGGVGEGRWPSTNWESKKKGRCGPHSPQAYG